MFLSFGYQKSFKILDKGFLEVFGPYGLSQIVKITSQNFSILQTGQITHYLFFSVLGLILYFFIQLQTFYLTSSLDSCLFTLYSLYLSLFHNNFNFKI